MELDKERARKRWREIRWKIEKEMLGARRKEGKGQKNNKLLSNKILRKPIFITFP